MGKQSTKQIASNRKAFHDYFIEDKYEAGIELAGTEVKSIRLGAVNLRDSFCSVKDGEMFLHGMHISPYERAISSTRTPGVPEGCCSTAGRSASSRPGCSRTATR